MTNTCTENLTSLIKGRQAELGVSDVHLASALGYQHARVIDLIKQGHMRLPINKVKALATALSIDPKAVLQLAMEEAAPGLLDVIEDVLNPLKLSAGEDRLIRRCRKLAQGGEEAPIMIDGKSVVALITV